MRKTKHRPRGRASQVATRATAKGRLTRRDRHEAARERWRRAAGNFRGLSVLLRSKNELRHITQMPDGYQVRIVRGKKPVFSRHIAGLSEESLLKAMRVRDKAVRELPRERRYPIPPAVLRELGLSAPVIGICRLKSQLAFRASYRTRDGRKHGRSFYYRQVPEAVAYAAAIVFLQEVLEQKKER